MLKKLFLVLCAAFAAFAATACTVEDEPDTKAPEFQNATNGALPEMNVLVKSKTGEAELLKDVKAIDDVDGEVTVTVTVGTFDVTKVGEYTITYTAADAAGNIATVKRVVKVVDSTAPYFQYSNTENKLPELSILQYTTTDLTALEYLEIIDNYDTELKATVKDDGGFNVEVAGEYTVTYEAKDTSGNATTATKKITVEPGIKYIEDVLTINGKSHAAQFNNPTALQDAKNGYGMRMRTVNVVQVMTKACYLAELAEFGADFATNGNIPFLPYGVVVVTDADFKPVLVRNATYAIEAILGADGEWDVHKGQDLKFIDSTTMSSAGVGILGGNLTDYIPEGGYVLMAGAPLGGALDTAKIFLVSNTLAAGFTGGGLSWDLTDGSAQELLPKAQFTFEKDSVTIYPKPADLEAPTLTMNKHVLSWNKVEGAKEYELYVNGELKTTLTATTVKMIDLGLEPSAEGETYKLQIKAITNDIRKAGDSELSSVLEYAMPNSTELTAPVVTLTDTTISWEAVEGATGYEVYAEQVENKLVATVTTTSLDLKTVDAVNALVANARITVKALGDDVEYLDSIASQGVIYFCSEQRVLKVGDVKVPAIVTTAADYFARRNLQGDLGYVGKDYLYAITDPTNIAAGSVEAYGFLAVVDRAGAVKAMINILNTTKQYFNYEWVDAASIGYTGNGQQITPLLPVFAEGDMLIIGRQTGKFEVDGLQFTQGRDVMAHLFWGKFTADTLASGQPWRSAASITTLPTVEVKLANEKKLDAPVLTIDGSKVKWDAVDGADAYAVYLNDELVSAESATFVDLSLIVKVVGKTGTQGVNYTDVKVSVVATSETKEPSEKAEKGVRVSTSISNGTDAVDVNLNVKSVLFNGGSGASCRLTDATSSLLTGETYKAAVHDYCTISSTYDANAKNPFMQNGIIVILDKDLKVKVVRWGFVNAVQIDAQYNVTTPTTWNNGGQNATTGGGNFLNIENEVDDTDYVLIGTNVGSKVQLTAIAKAFVNTDAAALIVTRKAVADASIEATRINLATTQYQIVYTLGEIPA